MIEESGLRIISYIFFSEQIFEEVIVFNRSAKIRSLSEEVFKNLLHSIVVQSEHYWLKLLNHLIAFNRSRKSISLSEEYFSRFMFLNCNAKRISLSDGKL